MEILIVKLAALGDVLRTTSLLRPLQRRYPDSRIWWITQAAAKPLLEHNSYIERIVIDADAQLALAGKKFGLVLSLEEDLVMASLAERACSGDFIGVRNANDKLVYSKSSAPYYDMSLLNPDADGTHKTADALKATNRKTYAQLWLDVLGLAKSRRAVEARPILMLETKDRLAARQLALKYKLKPGKPIGINPGAGSRWPAKQISVERAAEIADALSARFKRPILLLGGKDEAERNRLIAKRAKSQVIDPGTDHGLREFAGLIECCGLLVATDSLAFHIATALGKPVVALVGPTSASELDVFGKGKILSPPEGCSCFYRAQCLLETSCIDRMPVEDILKAAASSLK